MFYEMILLHPGTACIFLSKEELTFLFKLSAVSAITESTFVLGGHAGGVKLVRLVLEAHVRIEHHLALNLFLGRSVDQLPLVLIGIASNCSFWTPAVRNDVSEVIIVEDTLILGISPKATIA